MTSKQAAFLLQARNLSIGYQVKNGTPKLIAEGLNFDLKVGELTCLLGPNGVGKSTLIKTIMGSLPVLAGEVQLKNQPIQSYRAADLAKELAVVLTDKIGGAQLTVEDLIGLGRTPHTNWLGKMSTEDQTKVDEAIAQTHVGYLRGSLIAELSDGQLQKVMIARAIAQDAGVLILDEPTAHLDLVNRFEIMFLLRKIAQESKKAILVVTHDLEIALETADQFWLMTCGDPLRTGLPEDLVCSGAINQLLPGKELFFDAAKGKVKLQSPIEEFAIHGNPVKAQWLAHALVKNGLKLPTDVTIEATEADFLWKEAGKEQRGFREIREVLDRCRGLR
ncbi:ABC transporter ATP-binding protein [Mongoliitalea daihaiensis]|uniref:ABC transporter ATP-binding protein n=1 Tax=Mongoliitalea daihaiensis TaxID=2782006 RepID=UPI001F17FC60|nr:ABC transporter ATP-binding protein [Mongoliitalea daihaiensis]UJP66683.1 ABC transporter ATP-binding protein [Mongoliitalea daihaiensis]